MKFSTTRFGELEVSPEKVLTFPFGLIGFSEVRRFAVVDNPAGGPFQWLQAVDVPDLAFVITDPSIFFKDYQVPVRVEDLRTIGIERIDEGVVVVILVVPRDPRHITANLLGPIVINLRDRLARQLVLEATEYNTRHYLFSSGDAFGAPESEAADARGHVTARAGLSSEEREGGEEAC